MVGAVYWFSVLVSSELYVAMSVMGQTYENEVFFFFFS